MSKKRWFAITLVFAITIAAVIVIPALWPPTPGVTYANFSRIEMGMPREQVESLLGKSNGERGDDWPPFGVRALNETGWASWQHGDDFASVHFDDKDRVTIMTWNGWSDERTAWE